LAEGPSFAMPVCKFIFTARFARGAENNNFSIAVERTAMEKNYAAYATRKQRMIYSFDTTAT
jgi:hypothetical protein